MRVSCAFPTTMSSPDDIKLAEDIGYERAWLYDTPQQSPDVWMSFSATWPLDDPARLQAFFNDLLAELESMADTADRCRWPVDEPWTLPSHHH